jgi:TrmH family RNA methyltransferase
VTGRPAAPELTNARAERVRSVRSLAGRPARQRQGLFLVEGPQGVREAVRWAARDVRDVYISAPPDERTAGVAAEARDAGIRVHVASAEVVDAMSPDAQGVLAVVRIVRPTLAGVLDRSPRLVAVLAAVRDPGNAGTVVRAADAAGADAVVLTAASVDAHNPKVVRASAGSLLHLPVVTGADLPEAVAVLRAAGLAVLATDAGAPLDLDDLLDAARHAPGEGAGSDVPDLTRPTAWLFGNEAWGLPAEHRALADAVVRVPIHGRAESLNLATAAAICLYASARAQRGRR